MARGVSSPHFAKVACFTLIFANDTLKVSDVTSCRHSSTTLELRDDHEGPSSEIPFSRCFKGNIYSGLPHFVRNTENFVNIPVRAPALDSSNSFLFDSVSFIDAL